MTDPKKQFREILSDFDHAMLVTLDPDGAPRARPMAIADEESDGDLWFVTGVESGKVDELESDVRCGVTMQGKGEFLSITGVAQLVRDRTKIEALFREPMKAWFPKGVDDPRLALLRFRAERAEYWDSSGLDGVKYAFEAAKAVAKGERVEKTDRSQHAEVDLR
ncbi:MAG TPA: pyridoxamine 5'-phosphate oxidase family protein [Sandaracinaceae bacterium LLY-WYZ-13_1]|nr:pyridoxamine 5'-phosphate oxidase family protein [Sandaracinaceae bacterium LLY-WYZ-13_1]